VRRGKKDGQTPAWRALPALYLVDTTDVWGKHLLTDA
jgi:hypothetical protein